MSGVENSNVYKIASVDLLNSLSFILLLTCDYPQVDGDDLSICWLNKQQLC